TACRTAWSISTPDMLDGSIRAAVTIGFPTTAGGHRHSSDTPTSESIRPRSAMISVALGRNEQMRTAPDVSLCESCVFMRLVENRRGSRFLLCLNVMIQTKYPRQPVLACPGYAPGRKSGPDE